MTFRLFILDLIWVSNNKVSYETELFYAQVIFKCNKRGRKKLRALVFTNWLGDRRELRNG